MTTLLASSRKIQFAGRHRDAVSSAHFSLMMLLLVFLAAFHDHCWAISQLQRAGRD